MGSSFTAKTRAMHEAMGSAMTDWVWVEDGLVKLISTLLGCSLEQAGIVWYSVVSFNGKLEMIDSLMRHAHEGKPIMSYWPSCYDYLRKLSGYRNRIAHWELVSLHPHSFEGHRPFDEHSQARLVPHNFDVRDRMMKFREDAGVGIEDVRFYSGQFSWMGMELSELWLAQNDKIPWPDKFSRPLTRPQSQDDLWPLNRSEPDADLIHPGLPRSE